MAEGGGGGGNGGSFTTGEKVEVTSDEEGFRGAWFEATVVRILPRLRRYTVEYESLLADGGRKRLRETVEWRNVRPRRTDTDRDGLGVDRVVDAYYNDAWWTGVVAKVRCKTEEAGGDGDRYTVYFPGTEEVIEFGESQVRVHREWVDGEWVDRQGKENQKVGAGISKGLLERQQPDIVFRQGMQVEVTSDEEGFRGSWFSATIIEQRGNDMFLVEYPDLRTDDEKELLREAVHTVHIRPTPPSAKLANLKLLEEVDARYNDGWWVGVISKVLQGNRYMVYFKQTSEELEFDRDDLRLHFDWVKGKWIRASQVLGF